MKHVLKPALAFFCFLIASVRVESHAAPLRCAPDEHTFDLSHDIRPGTAAVWLIPVGAIHGRITYYELGHPEGRVPFGGGGNGSAIPHRLDLHGQFVICVAGEGVQGFIIQRSEPGA